MISFGGIAVNIHRVGHLRSNQHPVAIYVARMSARPSAMDGEIVQAKHILVARYAVHRYIFGRCRHHKGVFVPIGNGCDNITVQGDETAGIRVRHRISCHEFLVRKPVGKTAGEKREGERFGEVQLRAYNPVVVGHVRMEWAPEKPVSRMCRGVVLVPDEEIVVQHNKGHR